MFDVNKINAWWNRGESPGEIFPILPFFSGSGFPVIRLKTGGYAVLFELAGIDSDGKSRANLDEISRKLRNIWAVLPAGCVIYNYQVSRPMDLIPNVDEGGNEALVYRNQRVNHLNRAGLKSVSLYVCLYLPGPTLIDKLSVVDYGNRKTIQLRKIQAAARLFERQMNSAVCTTRMCTKSEATMFFSFLQTLDLRLTTRNLPVGGEVSHKLCGAEISWTPLRIGRNYVRPFALLDRPDGTRPNMYAALMGLQSQVVLCGIWRPWTSGEVRKQVKTEESRKGFSEVSWADAASGYLSGDHTSHLLVGPSAQKLANEKSVGKLSEVLDELTVHRVGEYSLYGFLYGPDPVAIESDAIELETIFLNPSNTKVISEQTGALSAYLSVFPGNDVYAKRSIWLRDDHVADMSPIYKPFNGTLFSEDIGGEWTQAYQTPSRTPFFVTSFYKQLGNMIVNGGPRLGKSLNVNYLVLGEAKFDGFVYIFDVGGSYDYTVQMLGGSCAKVGLDGPRWAPFAEPHSKTSVNAILNLVRAMLEKGGVQVGYAEEEIILNAIDKVYASHASIRNLSLLSIFLGDLGAGLKKWTGEGIYAALFDNVTPSMELGKIQSFDFAEIVGDKYKDILELVFGWIVYQVGKVVKDPANLGRPKLTVAEEIWKHVQTPAMFEFIIDSLKADPKNLGRLVVVMHSRDDLGPFAQQIRAVCPLTMFFGGNTTAPDFKDFYGLNQAEFETIQSLSPPRLAFKVSGNDGFFKELELNLSGEFLAMFTTTPYERKIRNELTAQHGYREALKLMGPRMNEIRQLSAAAGI